MLLDHQGKRPHTHETAYIGGHCIIMEQAVLRGTARHPVRLADHVLVGPHAHLSGCTVEDSVFVATGACGARLGAGSEVRINGVVHVNTAVPAGATVPIDWAAVGDPAQILPPNEHERIWAVQKTLEFPRTVFGLTPAPEGESIMPEMTPRYARALRAHRHDHVLGHHHL
jgi:carbonic anhydrase/acetyltransferase-like protein (isoleucine patch superfamily)